jgi:hypothetical protein
MVTVVIVIASVATVTSQTAKLTARRSNMVQALQFAEGGAVIAAGDLNAAVTNSGSFLTNLLAKGYVLNALLTSASSNVYQRTITSPFSNQSVTAQIWLPAGGSPATAKLVATATVDPVTQTAKLNVNMGWAYPGAIISVNAGTTSTSVAKSAAQDGNVVINGSKSGPTIVDGNSGKAVMANGRVNVDTNYTSLPTGSTTMTNWGSANQIPDYTSQGTSNALFDINRYVAVADSTPGGYSPATNNHFTNLLTFINAAKTHAATNPMEGVIVVDVSQSDKNTGGLTDSGIPNGINVKGTLLFNFIGAGWDPTSSKIIITADLNVNAANLSGLVATNPATYPTGYPPVYTDTTKSPTNINIVPKGFQNFVGTDDLPALLYSIGVVDIHGGVNISGVVYTPSYIELENKSSATQYIKGSVIMGYGIYYENSSSSISIISFDKNTVDSLTTLNSAGKQVVVTYWEQ